MIKYRMADDEFITIKISTKLFTGFEYKIVKDIYNKMTVEEIIKEVKIYMKNFFTFPHDLYILKTLIDELELHIHNCISSNESSYIIYLCENCECKN